MIMFSGVAVEGVSKAMIANILKSASVIIISSIISVVTYGNTSCSDDIVVVSNACTNIIVEINTYTNTNSSIESFRTFKITGSQFHDVLLTDLNGANTDPTISIQEHTPITDAIFNTHYLNNGEIDIITRESHKPQPCEPCPYTGQTLH